MKFIKIAQETEEQELAKKLHQELSRLKDQANEIEHSSEDNNELVAMMRGRWDALNDIQKFIIKLGFPIV